MQKVVFLGISERASYIAGTNKWNVLGLGYFVYPWLFPFDLGKSYFCFAINNKIIDGIKTFKFQITDDNKNEIGTISSTAELKTSLKDLPSDVRFWNSDNWSIAFINIPHGSTIYISKPGFYHISLATGEEVELLGTFQVIPYTAYPMTEERKAAIKSDPNASKAVRLDIIFKCCTSKLQVYTALERSSEYESQGLLWYETVADTFICECKKNTIDTSFMRSNMHVLLGQRQADSSDISFIPMYERSSLESIRAAFKSLLDTNPSEEELQTFIEKYPILLHQFPARKVLHKPPILTKYFADFAIVTSQKELILIEIEKTKTKLMKSNGHRHSELTHAIDQVNDWLNTITEHRLAVLNELNIKPDEINIIKGVVIAGREQNYDPIKMRRLKMTQEAGVYFLTFDDLLLSLDSLINKFNAL